MNPLARLSDRDQAIITTVETFKLVTTSQVMRLHFDDPGSKERSRHIRTCRAMVRLTKWKQLKRTGRAIGAESGGSSEYVYLMPSSSAGSAPLHTIAIAELFTQMVQAHRQGKLELLKFQPEEDGYRQYGNTIVTCDARARIRTTTGTYPVFIEVDRGRRDSAENRKQLKAKMNRYISAQAQRTKNLFPMVVFFAPTEERCEFIRSVARATNLPELFEVQLMDNAIDYLSSM